MNIYDSFQLYKVMFNFRVKVGYLVQILSDGTPASQPVWRLDVQSQTLE
jgi:hypothetical protein